MRRAGLVALVATLALTGCGFGARDEVERPGVGQPGVGQPTPQATPSEPRYDRRDLSEQTELILMAHGALLNVGGPPRAADVFDEEHPSANICNGRGRHEGRTGHVAHERVWMAGAFTAHNVAHGFVRKTGAETVREVREAAGTCTTFRVTYYGMYSDERSELAESVTYDLLGAVEFPAPGGVEDSYGGCFTETYLSGLQRVVCFAYLGRRNLLSALYVTAGMDQAAARTKLLQIIPIAAAALAAA